MKLTIVTAIAGLLVVVVILELLRRRQLREKYAVLWLVVGLIVVPLGAFPKMLDSVATTAGVRSGVSLVLFLGFVFLLLVCIHLSWESSRLEEETRSLAEEVALIRTQLAEQERTAAIALIRTESAERERAND
ncbi:DUF2304 domain-containing protein [Embleya sp. NPDC055664]|uniref:DUF2304 domain-containing protein n=1 Tax=Embleya scabrispora TaxID=159449 RepID=A0A1T3NY43_9ACTN|nr:DUF2304 domain-containing protein [Embleya scabrispora]OPC81749.1 hypothetical protein B4N89_13090 [Embleya scabrispora]